MPNTSPRVPSFLRAAGLLIALLALLPLSGIAANPFQPRVEARAESPSTVTLSIHFPVPAGHHLYADSVAISLADNRALTTRSFPAAVTIHDALSETNRLAYEKDADFVYALPLRQGESAALTVAFQGCSATVCFAPGAARFIVTPAGAADFAKAGNPPPSAGSSRETSASQKTPVSPNPPGSTNPPAVSAPPLLCPTTGTASGGAGPVWCPPLGGFRTLKNAGGYLNAREFMQFLDDAENAGKRPAPQASGGGFLLLVFTLLGGMLLNLTPCVLPMIPINLAIIGAEAEGGSRLKGFLLGGLYALGMTIAFGGLGLLALLANKPFGTLQSNPWFQFAAGTVFLVLSLAAFGVFHIDLTRYRPGNRHYALLQESEFLLAFVMGGVAALLSGACVTPLILATLLQAENLQSQGNSALGGALLFVLGAGMGLPWPFAGAGLSFLPRPGRWMHRVSQALGIFILVLAVMRFYTGVELLRSVPASLSQTMPAGSKQALKFAAGGWEMSLPDALEKARNEKKILFVDFWATWCPNCAEMERMTFSDPAVNERMRKYVRLKIQAERFDDPSTRLLLRYFDVKGLPAYAVLAPEP